MLALLWFEWHIQLFPIARSAQVGASMFGHLIFFIGASLLITMLYNPSGGAILPAMLFHTGMNIAAFGLNFDTGFTGNLVMLLFACTAVLLCPHPLFGAPSPRTSGQPARAR